MSGGTAVAYRRDDADELTDSQPVLPPDLFNRFVNDAFWRDLRKIPEGLPVL